MFDDFDIMVQSDELAGCADYEDYLDYLENDDELYHSSYDKSYYDYQENRLLPYRRLDI